MQFVNIEGLVDDHDFNEFKIQMLNLLTKEVVLNNDKMIKKNEKEVEEMIIFMREMLAENIVKSSIDCKRILDENQVSLKDSSDLQDAKIN